MNINLIQQYNSLLATLKQQQCNIFHFIVYRKNKIANVPFEQVLQMNTFIPSQVLLDKIIIENDNDKYVNYKNNVHHWTTSYVWKKFIPKLMNQLHIDFHQDKFIEIPYIWNSCNFSYHKLNNQKFKVIENRHSQFIGDHDILRQVNDCPNQILSLYHSLFRLAHKSGQIFNFNDAPLDRVVVNCDSMAIPMIPILACFCKQMLIIDNRTGKNMLFEKQIIDFKPTHYIALFTEENFLFNRKHILNLN